MGTNIYLSLFSIFLTFFPDPNSSDPFYQYFQDTLHKVSKPKDFKYCISSMEENLEVIKWQETFVSRKSHRLL